MRIDVHHHAIVPKIQRLMREQGAPFSIPWSLAETYAVMESNDIGFALVSNAIPGDLFGDAGQAARFTRAANEAVAELVADHPDRFGLLAALPMPHQRAALAELDYAFDRLGADGVVLVPHAGDAYLGDPPFAPVLAALNARRASVLVHPMALPGQARPSVPPVLADFLLDTTRGAISLAAGGALDRYPDVNFILAHGGGFLPYAASRVVSLGHAFFGYDRDRLAESLRRFFYDTALTSPSGLPSLLRMVPPERILFGSDWCAAPADVVAAGVAGLDDPRLGLSGVQRAAIDRTNAQALFPRVAGRVAARASAAERRR
jgi:predicted TIM-barrel fold metal-dependent hydrolase